MSTTLAVTVLTEDKGGYEVVKTLVRLLLSRVVEPRTRTHRLAFFPSDERHRAAVRANAWRSTSNRDQSRRTELNKYLATVLKGAGPVQVVVHHVDADEAWSGELRCDAVGRWEKMVAEPVARLCDDPTLSSRLVPLVPHPEIEAWLFLHTERLQELSVRHQEMLPPAPPGGWESLNAVKDEYWPHGAYNVELVTGFPVVRALAASPSLQAAVARLRSVPGLAEALAATLE